MALKPTWNSRPGKMFWHEEELRHQLQNRGNTTLQVVDLEWK